MARLIGILLALLVLAVPALAEAAARVDVPHQLVELRRVAGSYEASFEVRNTGDEPLYVSRVAPRTDTDDVRLPRHLTARFASGLTSGVIPPHGAGVVRVAWAPDREVAVRSFFGHVVVTSTDEQAGEVAVGIAVHAGRWGSATKHLLSAMVALPLLAALALGLLVLAAEAPADSRRPRVVALVATLASAVLALVAWGTFDPDLVRADGGEMLQHVERAVALRALGVEVSLGVDGASLPVLVLCAVGAPCGVLAAWDQRKSPAVFFCFYLLFCGASLGAILSLDAAIYLACLALATFAAFVLVALFGRGERPSDPREAAAAANRMLMGCGVGLVALAVAIGTLHAGGTHTFLVDGTPVRHTWAFSELARIKTAEPAAHRALVLSLVGIGLMAGVFPLHLWLAPFLRAAPPAVAMMTCLGLTRAALLGLLRLDAVVLPEALRWAAPAVVAVGAAGMTYAALVAMAEKNLVGIATFGLVCLSGAVTVGLTAGSSEAMLGAVTGLSTSGAAVGLMLLATGALEQRTGTVDVGTVRGLGIEAPLLAAFLGVAALAVGALPGTASFWTAWLVGLGTIVSDLRIAMVVLVATVLLAASQATPVLRVLRGRLPDVLRRSEPLTPYGGHVPDLRAREVAAMAPLLLAVVLLGFYPAPLIGRAQATARDVAELSGAAVE